MMEDARSLSDNTNSNGALSKESDAESSAAVPKQIMSDAIVIENDDHEDALMKLTSENEDLENQIKQLEQQLEKSAHEETKTEKVKEEMKQVQQEWKLVEVVRPEGSLGLQLGWPNSDDMAGSIEIMKVMPTAPKDIRSTFQPKDKVLKINGIVPMTFQLMQQALFKTPVGGLLLFSILREHEVVICPFCNGVKRKKNFKLHKNICKKKAEKLLRELGPQEAPPVADAEPPKPPEEDAVVIEEVPCIVCSKPVPKHLIAEHQKSCTGKGAAPCVFCSKEISIIHPSHMKNHYQRGCLVFREDGAKEDCKFCNMKIPVETMDEHLLRCLKHPEFKKNEEILYKGKGKCCYCLSYQSKAVLELHERGCLKNPSRTRGQVKSKKRKMADRQLTNIMDIQEGTLSLVKAKEFLKFGQIIEHLSITKTDNLGLKCQLQQRSHGVEMLFIEKILTDTAGQEAQDKFTEGSWIVIFDDSPYTKAFNVATGSILNLTILHPYGAFRRLERSSKKWLDLTAKKKQKQSDLKDANGKTSFEEAALYEGTVTLLPFEEIEMFEEKFEEVCKVTPKHYLKILINDWHEEGLILSNEQAGVPPTFLGFCEQTTEEMMEKLRVGDIFLSVGGSLPTKQRPLPALLRKCRQSSDALELKVLRQGKALRTFGFEPKQRRRKPPHNRSGGGQKKPSERVGQKKPSERVGEEEPSEQGGKKGLSERDGKKEMIEVVVEEKCDAPSNRSFGLSLGWDTPEQKAQGYFLRILDIYKQRCPEEIQSVLRKGDQLLFIEGQAIEDIMDVKEVTNRAKIGSTLTFTMLRSVPTLHSSHRCVDCASHNRRCDQGYPTCEVCNELEMECHYPENAITITERLVNDEKKRVEDVKTAWQQEVSRRHAHAKKTQRSKQAPERKGLPRGRPRKYPLQSTISEVGSSAVSKEKEHIHAQKDSSNKINAKDENNWLLQKLLPDDDSSNNNDQQRIYGSVDRAELEYLMKLEDDYVHHPVIVHEVSRRHAHAKKTQQSKQDDENQSSKNKRKLEELKAALPPPKQSAKRTPRPLPPSSKKEKATEAAVAVAPSKAVAIINANVTRKPAAKTLGRKTLPARVEKDDTQRVAPDVATTLTPRTAEPKSPVAPAVISLVDSGDTDSEPGVGEETMI